MGMYKLILQMKIMGLSDEEIARTIKPRNIVFSPGQFEKEIRQAGLGRFILWDDAGLWMSPWIPRPSKFSEFWMGVDDIR
jgi:hypothetical protein